MKSMFRSVDRAQCERSPSNGEVVWEATSSYGNGRKAWEDVGISFSNNKENR
jgi:hypothetical protein